MSTKAPPWDRVLKDITKGMQKAVAPYSGRIETQNSHLGYPLLTLVVAYGKTEVRREVQLSYTSDGDQDALRRDIQNQIIPALDEAVAEIMDPGGNMKTISVKEVYANGSAKQTDP